MALTADITLAAAQSTSLRQVIGPYMGVFFAGFFIAFILTPVLRMLAVRNGVIDWPDYHRKSHPQPVAYLGGVALFMGWLVAVLSSYFTTPHAAAIDEGVAFVDFPVSVILGAGAIAVTGLFDDVYGVSPRVKIGGQLFAAAALSLQPLGPNLINHAAAAVGLECPELLAMVLGAALITVLVLGGCNAMNLLDGLDGLAAGIGAIAALGFLLIAGLLAIEHAGGEGMTATHSLNDPKRIVMCLAILGALLGFLPYNFNPATIFMGDAGSLLLGYLCIAAMLLFAANPQTADGVAGAPLKTVTACLIVFALPIIDTSLAIFRRKMRGRPILSPDKEHIHHLLRRGGLSVRQVVGLLYAVSLGFAAIGVLLVALDFQWRYMIAVFVVLYGFVVVTAYKYGQRQRQREPEDPADPVSPAATDAEPATPQADVHGNGDAESTRRSRQTPSH